MVFRAVFNVGQVTRIIRFLSAMPIAPLCCVFINEIPKRCRSECDNEKNRIKRKEQEEINQETDTALQDIGKRFPYCLRRLVITAHSFTCLFNFILYCLTFNVWIRGDCHFFAGFHNKMRTQIDAPDQCILICVGCQSFNEQQHSGKDSNCSEQFFQWRCTLHLTKNNRRKEQLRYTSQHIQCGEYEATAYWTEFGELIKGFNRVFNYFVYFSRDKERSLDIRMYQQEKISRLYLEKEKLFKVGYMVSTTRGPMGLWAGVSGAVSAVFTGLAYAFVCLKAWAGAFGVGSVAQYVGAITALSTHIGALVSAWGELRANAAFLRKTFEFLDIPNKMYQGSLTTEKRSDRNYEIEFRDVSFKYPGSEEYALRHVSMKFRVGERLAVVGQNGSGKTTFIKLLCRLYDPTEGVILLNGIDIRKYDYDEYIALFSVVFQDFKLLAFSLGQNVAASVEYDRGRVQDCLEKAGFSTRLEGMPNGIDTNLYKEFDENGVQISGGEAQKIALARALYKDAPFVVLDEPTAALDPIAEMEIYSKFNKIVGDKTAIYISHRLSSCRFCDNVAVFDHGEIVQRGSPDTLVRNEEGKYFELWNAQAQYYV